MEVKIPKKQRQQVLKVQYLTSKNVIELTFDEGQGVGCKNQGHAKVRFPKLYVIPCPKTLKCAYFKTIFEEKPYDDIEIEVCLKQQYFIHYCHKICSSCLDNLYVQNSTHIQCRECQEENIHDFSYCHELMNMWLCTSFNIHDFKEFHDIYKGFESHIIQENELNLKKKMKSTPFMILQCKFIFRGFVEFEILRKFGIKEDMRVMISFSNVPNEYKNERVYKRKNISKNSEPLPFWEDGQYSSEWKNYYSSDLIKTQFEPLLVLNGNNIIEDNIFDFKNLTFEMILLIYHPKLWEDFSYKSIVNEVNHYYLTSPYKGKKNQTNPKRGQYPSICHGYSAHGGESSKGCVVMYSQSNLDDEIQMSYRAMGDNISSSIWKHVSKFGNAVEDFFKKQFFPINCIPIGLEGYKTQVHQIHISKNSFIQPHIDPSDMEASYISWFVKGRPKGGLFGVFQHCLKFDNDNGAGIFIKSKNITHGTLPFDRISLNDFKLGVAMVNKTWLHTRLRNQLKGGTSLTFKSNEWYIEDPDNSKNI